MEVGRLAQRAHGTFRRELMQDAGCRAQKRGSGLGVRMARGAWIRAVGGGAWGKLVLIRWQGH